MMTQLIDVQPSAAESYLKQPYARVIIPESDGSFRGEIIEFPGCIATGESPTEALQNLENAALDWLLATLANNQNVPQPIESSNAFSGRLVLRLPKSLHKKVSLTAEREGTSLNQFIVYSLAEAIGEARKPNNVFVSFHSGKFQKLDLQSQVASMSSGNATLFPVNFVPMRISNYG